MSHVNIDHLRMNFVVNDNDDNDNDNDNDDNDTCRTKI